MGTELTFKRHAMSPAMAAAYMAVFYILGGFMNIYVYSDESGVFDKAHNQYYVYGGLIFLSKESRDLANRKYIAVERQIAPNYPAGTELKASVIDGKHKRRLFGITNGFIRFGGIIEQNNVNSGFFHHKKSKQRYLDYVYKLSLKNALLHLHDHSGLDLDLIERMIIYTDEHTTATDGIYELREAIYQELHIGTINYEYNKYFPPILNNLADVDLKSCDSKKVALVRAADIVANSIFRSVTKQIKINANIILKKFP